MPPALIQLKAEADTDLTDYQTVAVDTTTAKTTMDCTRHNKAVRDAVARKAAATETLLSSIRNLKNGVAQDLIEALSPRAPLRLKAMLDAHKDAHVAQCYDGVAMFKELIALKNTTGLVEESIDHDIAVEEMRDTQLPDGCAVSEFTAKVNSLIKDHAPYMTNGFKDQTSMNKFIVRLMPSVNAAEGRQLVRELENSGTMDDQKIVMRRCVEIVLETQSPANRAASAAVPRRRPSGQSPSPGDDGPPPPA